MYLGYQGWIRHSGSAGVERNVELRRVAVRQGKRQSGGRPLDTSVRYPIRHERAGGHLDWRWELYSSERAYKPQTHLI